MTSRSSAASSGGRALRLALAGAALTLVLAAAASARDPQTSERALIPPDRIGVVVLDLSLSITDDDYAAIRRTLRSLVAEDATIGARRVLGRPVRAASSRDLRDGAEADPPSPRRAAARARRNPWTQTFRAGTRISAALELAKSMLERDQVAGRLDPPRQRPRDGARRRPRARAHDRGASARGHPASRRAARALERRVSLFEGLLEKDADRRLRASQVPAAPTATPRDRRRDSRALARARRAALPRCSPRTSACRPARAARVRGPRGIPA